MGREIKIVENGQELARAAAVEFTRLAIESVKKSGRFSVALSGGSTPKVMYSLLASDSEFAAILPWNQIHFYFGDERFVPADSPESNYKMVKEALFDHAAIPPENIHSVRTDLPTSEAAAYEYSAELAAEFGNNQDGLPTFDLILLGMGPDGHTASLFPGSSAITEQKKTVVANWVDKFNMFRITFTFPLINNAANVMFIVGGHDKAEMVKRVLEGESTGELLPSQMISPRDGRLVWLLDRDAAALIDH